jgi:hypothetical protein
LRDRKRITKEGENNTANKIFAIAAIIIISSLCVISNLQTVKATVYSDVTTGQVFDPYDNDLIGKYGCSVARQRTGGIEDQCFFYPTFEAKACNDWEVWNMKISVTGCKPNGDPINGFSGYNNQDHNTSPQSIGSDWENTLDWVRDSISLLDPSGITDYITAGSDGDGGFWDGWTATTDKDNDGTWAEFQVQGLHMGDFTQRGLQFKFSLMCDNDMGGTYLLIIHYHLQLRVPSSSQQVTEDIYQQITYEYTPSHVETVMDAGVLSPYVEIYYPQWLTGYAPDRSDALIGCSQGGAGYISGMMDSEQTGYTDIYLYGYAAWAGGFVYTYVSETNGNWQPVGYCWIEPVQ